MADHLAVAGMKIEYDDIKLFCLLFFNSHIVNTVQRFVGSDATTAHAPTLHTRARPTAPRSACKQRMCDAMPFHTMLLSLFPAHSKPYRKTPGATWVPEIDPRMTLLVQYSAAGPAAGPVAAPAATCSKCSRAQSVAGSPYCAACASTMYEKAR